jgi:hypothetical protein
MTPPIKALTQRISLKEKHHAHKQASGAKNYRAFCAVFARYFFARYFIDKIEIHTSYKGDHHHMHKPRRTPGMQTRLIHSPQAANRVHRRL